MLLLRRCLVVLLSLLSIVSAAGAPRSAQPAPTACPAEGCRLYLPALVHQVAPILIAPASGKLLTTLAPSFVWHPAISGQHKIQVSTDPDFSALNSLVVNSTRQVQTPSPQSIHTQITSNLQFGTTYFWRAGVVLPQGVVYSPAQSFTTPAEGTIQLPGLVTIISPQNNARLTGHRVLLNWVAIPGAQLYRIRMFDGNGELFDPGTVQLAGEITTFWVENVPAGTYTWRIKVDTATGWGPNPNTDYTFTMS